MKTPGSASSSPLAGEQDLVKDAQDGDSEAFARLYDAYVARVYRYAYYRVSDDQLAQDITSEVFLKAWEKLDHYQGGSHPFIAWLYRIAHNAIIDHYRTDKPVVALEETVAESPDLGTALEERLDLLSNTEQLRQVLRRLTDEQQEVLTLKFISGMSTPEVARQMGKRQGAIRALQMRALQALVKELDLLESEDGVGT